MDRGLYAASSAGLLGAKRLDIVANNLANANTVGFKAERLVSRQQQFSDTLASRMQDNLLQDGTERAPKDHDRTPGVVQIASETDFTPGPVSNTGNPLDVALGRANQFFVVSTPEGERLTRAGNFTKNANGTLVTPDGLSVQGDGGEIVLPAGEASISSNGAILVGKQVVGRLRVVEVNDLTQLRRTEGARFKSEGGTGEPVENPELITNSVEMPNISVVEAMVEMINAQKAFEAYTKSVRTIDELNERSIRNARLSG